MEGALPAMWPATPIIGAPTFMVMKFGDCCHKNNNHDSHGFLLLRPLLFHRDAVVTRPLLSKNAKIRRTHFGLGAALKHGEGSFGEDFDGMYRHPGSPDVHGHHGRVRDDLAFWPLFFSSGLCSSLLARLEEEQVACVVEIVLIPC